MELRVLRYFITAVREQGISKAADMLHVTQPTLSRQLMDLEYELGTTLLERNRQTKKLALTDAGMRLYSYAVQIVELADKAGTEISTKDSDIEGDVYIGTGESTIMHGIARAAINLNKKHPRFHYHILSGDSLLLMEKLDRGLIDFGIFIDIVNVEKYESIPLAHADRNGILMRKDHPLSQKKSIKISDLKDIPILVSQQLLSSAKDSTSGLNICGSYNLLYNAAVMVKEGYACAMCLDGIADTSEKSNLTFRSLNPPQLVKWNMAWRKGGQLSRAAQLFLNEIKETMV